MFSDKPYVEVNREERFYCAMLIHAILASVSVREKFVDILNRNLKLDIRDAQLKEANLEPFLEVAILRDYWRELGDPAAYTKETHEKRLLTMTELLEKLSIDPRIIYEHDFFWTTREHKKLWNPGRWNTNSIDLADLNKDSIDKPDLPTLLKKIKWAFNAKPDIMLISGKNIVFIEAKLESDEGRGGGQNGYFQYETQKLVAQIVKAMVPTYFGCKFYTTILDINPKNGISWLEIMACIDNSDLDVFTVNALQQLKRYY